MQRKLGEWAGWGSSSGGYVNPSGEDRLGVIPQELTPAFVSRAIKAADQGNLGLLQESYMKMIASDSHLRGEVNKLGMALNLYPLRVSPAKSGTPQAQEAAEMMENVLTNPAFKTREAIRSMAKVHFTGLRIYENDLRVQTGEDGLTMLDGLDLVPPTRYKMEMRKAEDDYGKIRILDTNDPDGVPLDSLPEGSITRISDAQRDGFWDLGGVGRTVLFWYCAKHFNAKWWNELNETYGEPVRIGYYDAWTEEGDRQEMRNFLKELGRAAWAILPSTQEFEFIMPDLGQVKTYEDIIRIADQQMSKAVVGQIGTSGRSENGSYGEASVLNSVRYEIVKSISGMVEEAIHPTVHFLCRANISPDFPIRDVPRVYIVVPNPEEKLQKVKLFKGALEVGMEVPRQHAYDELGIPVPTDGEDTLNPDDLVMGADGAPTGPEGEAEPSPSDEESGDEGRAGGSEEPEGENE